MKKKNLSTSSNKGGFKKKYIIISVQHSVCKNKKKEIVTLEAINFLLFSKNIVSN